jgi:excisionase family DNA binding protein
MEELLTVQEVAEKLKVHENTVYRYIQEGKLKTVRAGDLYRIRVSDLEDFLIGKLAE